MNNAFRKLLVNFLIPGGLFSIFVAYFFWQNLRYLDVPHWDALGGSDAILSGIYVKGMLENGWFGYFHRMGAPFGGNFLDFPNLDLLLLVLIKGISVFFSEPTQILAIFLICGFYLVFFSCFAVFRFLSFSVLWSMVAAYIFAILPFHFFRGFNHLMLSAYCSVPLWVWLSLKVYELTDLKALRHDGNRNLIMIGAFTVAGTMSGLYFAFFGMMCVTFSVVLNLVKHRCFSVLKLWAGIACLSLTSAMICIAQNLNYWAANGLNKAVGLRSPIESDLYGLRITQILFPNVRHEVGALQNLSQHYSSSLVPITEANTTAMGLIASIGFVCIICLLFVPYERYKQNSYYLLGRINLVFVLFATVGGFGVIFAYFVTPQFRGLNRLSVFIAFIAILFLWMLVKDLNLLRRIPAIPKKMLEIGASILLIAVVTIDQIPVGARLPTSVTSNPHAQSLSDFILEIEARSDPGTMVFNLPYVPFPEAPPKFEEGYNDMMRPIYYSDNLKWSYGSPRGRVGDEWLKLLDALPLSDRIQAVRKSGFSGVFVSRFAYEDRGLAVESELRRQGAIAEFGSEDERYSYFILEKEAFPSMVPNHVSVFGDGFYQEETLESETWNWSQKTGEMKLYNFSSGIMSATATFALSGIDTREVAISFNGDVLNTTEVYADRRIAFEEGIELQPGVNVLQLSSSRANVRLPTDPRRLAFRVFDFKLLLK